MTKTDHLTEICESCGLTKGSHSAGDYFSDHYQMKVPYNYCPGHEGRMDWDKGPGSIFKGTGVFAEPEFDKPASRKTRHQIGGSNDH
jgi:hypothetical protein